MYTTHTQIKQLRLFDVPVDKKEYLLMVSPPASIKKKVDAIKKDFGIRFSSKHALSSVAHMSMLGLRLKEKYEEGFINSISKTCEFYSPVTIHLNGFNGFAPHTIYIEVQKNHRLESLHYDLMESLYFKGPDFTPHLTIARQLKKHQYDEAIAEYKAKSFNDSFVVNSLVLFKREGEFTRYQMVAEFKLGMKIRSNGNINL